MSFTLHQQIELPSHNGMVSKSALKKKKKPPWQLGKLKAVTYSKDRKATKWTLLLACLTHGLTVIALCYIITLIKFEYLTLNKSFLVS